MQLKNWEIFQFANGKQKQDPELVRVSSEAGPNWKMGTKKNPTSSGAFLILSLLFKLVV